MTPRPTIHHADDGTITLVFSAPEEFRARSDAEAWLEARGFSVGRLQAHAPSGIIFGSYEIRKWRNLCAIEREALHGVLNGSRNGPVEVRIYAEAPQEARDAIVAERDAMPNAADRIVTAAMAVLVITFLAPIVFVGLHPLFAPSRPDVGKIVLRATPLRWAASLEAGR